MIDWGQVFADTVIAAALLDKRKTKSRLFLVASNLLQAKKLAPFS